MLTGHASRVAAQGGTIVSHAPVRAHWSVRVVRDVAILSGPAIAVVVTLAIAWEMRDTPLPCRVLRADRHRAAGAYCPVSTVACAA